MVSPPNQSPGMPFDKPFGHELRAEWLKALSSAEGLRVDTERRFKPRLKNRGSGAVERIKGDEKEFVNEITNNNAPFRPCP